MNIFDSLVSHTICNFSSSLTDVCFESTSVIGNKRQLDIFQFSKVLYKTQYIINKKLKSAKYFVFAYLEEIKRNNIRINKIIQPSQQNEVAKKQRGQKIIEIIEYVYEKGYKFQLKQQGFLCLKKNSEDKIFQFLKIIQNVVNKKRTLNQISCINQLKQISNNYCRIQLFSGIIDRIVKFQLNQKISQFFYEIIEYSKDTQLNKYQTQQLEYQNQDINSQIINQQKQDIVEYLTVINVFNGNYNSNISQQSNTYRYQLESIQKNVNQSSAIQYINRRESTDYGNFSIQNSIEHHTQEDIQSIREKKKIYLNNRYNNIKTESSTLDIKQSYPITLYLNQYNTTITLNDKILQYDILNGNKSIPVRQLHPDCIMKDTFGDLSDNLEVFPWSPLKDLTKTARLSSYSVTPFQVTLSKKKSSAGSILTKSQKYSPNITYQKPIYDSKELQRIVKTTSFKEQTIKKGKSNLFSDKKLKKTQPKSVQLNGIPQTSTKLLSFLRNQSKQEMRMSNPSKGFLKTTLFKNSNEQNKSKLTNSINPWALDKKQTATKLCDEQITISNPRIIRKFSPIALIRQKLTNKPRS